MVEDRIVIERIEGSPERKIFSIYCGDMPKEEAEAYVKAIMEKHKTKVIDNG